MAIVSRPHVRLLVTVIAVAASLDALIPLRMAMAKPSVPSVKGLQSSLKKGWDDVKEMIDPAQHGFEFLKDHGDQLQDFMPQPGGNSPPYTAGADVNTANPKLFIARIDINSPVTLTGPCQVPAVTVPCSALACRRLYGGQQPPNCAAAAAPCRYAYGGGVLYQGPVALSTTILPRNTVYACRLSPGADAVLGLARSSTLARTLRAFSYTLPVAVLYAGLAAAQQGGGKPTPLIANPVYPDRYYVGITRILVDGKALQIPPRALDLQWDGTGGVYLSTTVRIGMLLNREVYQVLVAALQNFSAPRKPSEFRNEKICYDMAAQSLPTIALVFTNDAVMELPPRGYVWQTQRDGARCLAILPSPFITGETVLGTLAQMGRRMTYQLAADDVDAGTVAF